MSTLAHIRLFLFDMDGTLYLGDRLFDFTPDLLAGIRECGARYLFMTNNSSKSVVDYVKKLARLGIDATEDDFITGLNKRIFNYIGNAYKEGDENLISMNSEFTLVLINTLMSAR